MSDTELSQYGFRKDYDPDNRVVKQEKITLGEINLFVSTVDLGLDHSFGIGEPLYYETMVFHENDWVELYMARYHTRNQAEEEHKLLIEKIKTGEMVLRGDLLEEKTNE